MKTLPLLALSLAIPVGFAEDAVPKPANGRGQPGRSAATLGPEFRAAIVVGVGQYPLGSDLNTLTWAAKDATDVEAVLRDQKYDVVIPAITDAKATKPLIKEAIRRLTTLTSTRNSTVVFFFSGHGFSDLESGINYLATIDTRLNDPARQGYSHTELVKDLQGTGAKRISIWIDACRTNAPLKTKGDLPAFRDFANAKGVETITAAGPASYSYELMSLQNGIFTHSLVKGLRGAAASSDGTITSNQLYTYLSVEVPKAALNADREQQPFRTISDMFGDFLLGRELAQKPDIPIVSGPQPTEKGSTTPPPPPMTSKIPPEALRRAQEILLRLDAADWGWLYDESSSLLKDAPVTREQFRAQVGVYTTNKGGKPNSRDIVVERYFDYDPQWKLAGEFVHIQYLARYAQGDVYEYLNLHKENSGAWRLYGIWYAIAPR